jgi:integrase
MPVADRLRRRFTQDEDGTLLEYPPKNGKARTVPLPAAACDELRDWLAAQKEYRLAQGPAWNEAGAWSRRRTAARWRPRP